MLRHSLGYSKVLILSSEPTGFIVLIDHKPLGGIFKNALFDLASPRLQQNWFPEKTLFIADAFSRAPLFSPTEMPNLDIDMANNCMVHTHDPALNVVLDSIDSDYRQFLKDIKNNTNLPSHQKLLHSDRDNLTLCYFILGKLSSPLLQS